MRRLFLNFFTLIIINSVIFPASALADDGATAEVKAYVSFSLDGASFSDETTIGMQLRQSSTDFNFGVDFESAEAPLLDLGLKLITGDNTTESAELLFFGQPVAIADADLGLVWIMPDFADASIWAQLANSSAQPASSSAKLECALPRC
ncbi:MAG: hypothetical protein SGJ17_12570 [Hyphomicrobiales bacterium]|nr:hypothetical protein [Hyphomicrobiales bacterium]